MNKLIISYEQGYSNWYISEFYKFFQKKLEENFNIKFEYLPISVFCQKFNRQINNSEPNIFNWYNLIIQNPSNGKMFVHSWNDYGQVIAEQIVRDDLNVVLFSSCSNITEDLLETYKNKLNIQPSVYCLEHWSNLKDIEKYYSDSTKLNKSFFIGYLYGIRENFHKSFKQSEYFVMKDRRFPGGNLNHETYYNTLSNYRFGMSFNGVAKICYRDLEIFGNGLINLREKLTTLTKNPIIKDVHYIEFFDELLIKSLISGFDIKKNCEHRFEKLLDEHNENNLFEISKISRNWYLNNCIPEKQYEILLDLTNKLEILND